MGEDDRRLLVPPGNTHLLADAMKYALDNPLLMREKGRNAFNYVMSNHKAEAHYQKMIKIYQKLK